MQLLTCEINKNVLKLPVVQVTFLKYAIYCIRSGLKITRIFFYTHIQFKVIYTVNHIKLKQTLLEYNILK